jgi:chromosome segregation ATPase
MESIKGGRGKKAPYQSTHCRIPEPIKKTVEDFAASYREFVANERDAQPLLDAVQLAIDASVEPESKAGTKHREKALRLQLEKVTADRDRQLIRLSELQTRMMDEIKKAYDDANKKNEQLENYNREIDRANGYLEKENRQLREKLAALLNP